ncbi:anthrone oxygenase family protein [Catenuloplanes indicus]|uniref:Membrane protein n=1 Tax=Catenuloplanes indicus TaxID=137267 RepID=A0AAE3W690_9ACTN|nr:anthrone oxygenase family protein [Catenuloplanes indicus]MDQ0370269.1 putative membrane protein [Catenuloplanes indicus]
MDLLADATLVLAGTLTALIAGLFFSFSFVTNRGLGRLGDIGYLRAMQSINVAIVNPVFLAAFLGPLVLLPLALILRLQDGWSAEGGLLLAACALYVVGGFGVTVGANIPLNNRLDAVDLHSATDAEASSVRRWFEVPWARWHALRTAATTLSVASVLVAALMS